METVFTFTPLLHTYYFPPKIDIGRFRRKKTEERIGPIYNTGILGEFHFVWVFVQHSQFREMLHAKVVNVEVNLISKEEYLYMI